MSDEDERPREETGKEEENVVVPDIIARMFRYGRTQEVVRAEEGAEEVFAVQLNHDVVPAAADEQEENHAAAPAKVQQFLCVLSEHEVDGEQEPRQEEADRPFREHGESREEESGVVTRALLL